MTRNFLFFIYFINFPTSVSSVGQRNIVLSLSWRWSISFCSPIFEDNKAPIEAKCSFRTLGSGSRLSPSWSLRHWVYYIIFLDWDSLLVFFGSLLFYQFELVLWRDYDFSLVFQGQRYPHNSWLFWKWKVLTYAQIKILIFQFLIQKKIKDFSLLIGCKYLTNLINFEGSVVSL